MHFYRDTKIGVLGGGQLGRMLIQAAVDYNLHIGVMDPNPEAPCRWLAHDFVVGSLTDYDAVMAFGKDKDVLTIEIENVNADALAALQAEGKRVYPDPATIKMIQDKRSQKQFFESYKIPTAPFVLVESKADVYRHMGRLPMVQKLAKAGYDGRGVQVLRDAEQVEEAFDAPGLLEEFVPFEKEIAVIVARNLSGEVATFPVVEMVFHPVHNLVEYLFAPANISPVLATEADHIARQIVDDLKFVGLLAIEMFVTPDGKILVNEMAPRPHNSGHHTIRANATSQYEQHLRAILDLPLGATYGLSPAAMVNLLGEAGHTGPAIYEGIEQLLATPGVYPHIYGKAETKPHRKMGHVTILDADVNRLEHTVQQVKELVKVVSG